MGESPRKFAFRDYAPDSAMLLLVKVSALFKLTHYQEAAVGGAVRDDEEKPTSVLSEQNELPE